MMRRLVGVQWELQRPLARTDQRFRRGSRVQSALCRGAMGIARRFGALSAAFRLCSSLGARVGPLQHPWLIFVTAP